MGRDAKFSWPLRIILTLGLSALVVVLVADLYRVFAPASWWLEVSEISVPDFHSGEDPEITVHREVKHPFPADWRVDVYQEPGSVYVRTCQGADSNDYKPSNKTLNVKLFTWWMGLEAPCPLKPGRYSIKSAWKMHPDGYPTKHKRAVSNVFEVFAPNPPN